jgi:hypothetical protein
MGAAAVGPDQGTGGSGVDQRLIPEEPMSIVLNLGISGAWVRFGWMDGGLMECVCVENWQDVDTTTMMFLSEFLIDYVRVYQGRGVRMLGVI